MSTNILKTNNNNNIKDVRNRQRQLAKRRALNQMKQFIEIEREEMRIQKNKKQRLRWQQMTKDRRGEQWRKDRERKKTTSTKNEWGWKGRIMKEKDCNWK